MSVAPDWVRIVPGVAGPPAGDKAMWSGEGDPPAIGDEIEIALNGIGLAKVVDYAVMDGYLGVMAYPLAPPAWWVKANGEPGPSSASIVFGAEIRYPKKEAAAAAVASAAGKALEAAYPFGYVSNDKEP
jgi:hypothetical protein